MREKIYSETTGRTYYPDDCVRLVNPRQMCFYMNHGIEIVDFYPSKDFKTGNDVVVFLVRKDDSKEVYKLWKERLQEISNEYGI